MSTIGIILLVAFVIVSIILICLVLVQDDGQNGMGGLLGGRGTAAFGSHSATVLTRATGVLVALFFVLAVVLALINKKPAQEKDLAPVETIEETASDAAAPEASAEESAPASSWWDSSKAAE